MSKLPKFPSKNELKEAIEVVVEAFHMLDSQGERGKWNQQALSILNLELTSRIEFVAQLEARKKQYDEWRKRSFRQFLREPFASELIDEFLEAFKE